MNKLIKISIVAFLSSLVLSLTINAQQIEDEISKISLKLNKDNAYLNLKYMTYKPDTIAVSNFQDIPRTREQEPCSFVSNKNTEYNIVFLNQGIGLDSIYLIYVDEIILNTLAGESFFVDESIKDDTTQVLSFKDLYTLKMSNSPYYKRLLRLVYNFVDENEGEALPSLLGVNPDENNSTAIGMTSRDNTDYYNFAKINSPHYFPSNKKRVISIRRTEADVPNMRLDVSFSKIGFSLKALDYNIGTTGFEVSLMEPILNLLPYESSTITAGVRTIFRLDNEKDVLKATFLDAKLMGRINLNSNSIFESNPFILGDVGKLNLSNAMVGDFTLTRAAGLPFLNLKFALGSTDFESPTFFVNETDVGKDAYFSVNQYEFTMSFHWNTSDKMTNRFRLDIGVGGFDIQRATYNSDNNFLDSFSASSFITPLAQLHYNFVPANKPFLGASVKVFHWRINALAWIKLFEFSEDSTLRFESIIISEPITRDIHPWESDGGVMFQLRYRHGL
ncbi:MAG: hypothetical protein ABFS12_01525 [Bacteroidota bacterium]